jgi:arsenite-transporting ATPase
MLSVRFGEGPIPVPGASNLWAMNVDPDAAAEAYRRRVIEPYIGRVSEAEIAKIREELSGACTVEIAAFDEFAGLLGGDEGAGSEFDHVIFDTAPTGHTLRLLSLPQAWSSFLEHNDRGAACLGPHSGLTMQQTRFEAARNSLADPVSTTVVLVARPDASALSEAARSSVELSDLGLGNQRLIVNGVFRATDREDSIALALEHRAEAALAAMPQPLPGCPATRCRSSLSTWSACRRCGRCSLRMARKSFRAGQQHRGRRSTSRRSPSSWPSWRRRVMA